MARNKSDKPLDDSTNGEGKPAPEAMMAITFSKTAHVACKVEGCDVLPLDGTMTIKDLLEKLAGYQERHEKHLYAGTLWAAQS